MISEGMDDVWVNSLTADAVVSLVNKLSDDGSGSGDGIGSTIGVWLGSGIVSGSGGGSGAGKDGRKGQPTKQTRKRGSSVFRRKGDNCKAQSPAATSILQQLRAAAVVPAGEPSAASAPVTSTATVATNTQQQQPNPAPAASG
jgi:hypothetical protein